MHSSNYCCHGKSIGITYSECVSVALVIQHANCIHYIVLSSVASLVLPCFSTLSHKWHSRRKLLNIKCVFWYSLQLLCVTFLILRRIWEDSFINVHTSSRKKYLLLLLLLLPDFNETWIVSTEFQKTLKNQMSWKSIQWQPSCSKKIDRQTW
jgi:hypothetical protein